MFFALIGLIIVWFILAFFLPSIGLTGFMAVYLIKQNPEAWTSHPISFGILIVILAIIAFIVDATRWSN
jgi:hypothetical protein